MVTVHLHQLVMQGHHGLYGEELKTGNNYEISLDVTYEERSQSFDSIRQTISYEDLYLIVKKRMQSPSQLLENVCDSIIRRIKHEYPEVRSVSVSIYKLHPPIENLQGKVGVTLRKTFDD
ncbi:MAG TPA: dihydroneopterin aldolase [Chitinophagaceae bacterium]|nr:dihydroneopterin aldolase [Chitinophagaceae bacterium]